jgi:hypothetical protein
MFVGVLTGRGIATADVAAAQAFAEFDPTLPDFETFLAAFAAGRDIWIGLLYVLTLRHESSSQKYLGWMNWQVGRIRAIQRARSRTRIKAAAQALVYNEVSRHVVISGGRN